VEHENNQRKYTIIFQCDGFISSEGLMPLLSYWPFYITKIYLCIIMCIVSFAAPIMKAKALSLSDFQLVVEPVRGRLIAEVCLTLKNSEVGMITL
jgi:hypothetical protein